MFVISSVSNENHFVQLHMNKNKNFRFIRLEENLWRKINICRSRCWSIVDDNKTESNQELQNVLIHLRRLIRWPERVFSFADEEKDRIIVLFYPFPMSCLHASRNLFFLRFFSNWKAKLENQRKFYLRIFTIFFSFETKGKANDSLSDTQHWTMTDNFLQFCFSLSKENEKTMKNKKIWRWQSNRKVFWDSTKSKTKRRRKIFDKYWLKYFL